MGEGHAELAEVIEVSDVLHALGAHLGADGARIGHQPLQYGGLAGLAGAAVHERSIGLDDVGAQGSHPVELANTGAEIVQSDGCTSRAEPRHGVGESSAVDVLKVFGELHHQGVEAGRHRSPEPTGGEGTRGGVDVEGLTNRSIRKGEGSGYCRGLQEIPVSIKVVRGGRPHGGRLSVPSKRLSASCPAILPVAMSTMGCSTMRNAGIAGGRVLSTTMPPWLRTRSRPVRLAS